jgi:hypothetical protein
MRRILAISAVCAIFVLFASILLFLSRSSFAERLYRDVFTNGRPSYLTFGDVYHENNITWVPIGPSKKSCIRWVSGIDWSERITWRKAYSSPSDPERKMLDIILREHGLKIADVDSIYSGIVDGSDIGYLISLNNPIDHDFYGIICVFRS